MVSDPALTLADDELVRRFREADGVAAFAELCRRHRRSIYNHCLAFLRNAADAEDLTQETCIRALVKKEQFRGGSFAEFSAWLCSIAKCLCIDHLRSQAARHERDNTGPPEGHPPPESRYLAAEILAVLSRLPVEQQICLRLFYIEGYSAKEISMLARYSDKNVKSYIQNGRRRFKLAWHAWAERRKH